MRDRIVALGDMSLTAGVRLGSYEIRSTLGRGGMGEVYLAHDHDLGRDVAVKVLPQDVSTDPDRLARFEREARVLAALNHPNIAAIYGVERIGDSRALVLELVDGPTLADRIVEGAIPVDGALAIARQIADAVEAAHTQGIVHRDLKPSNIKLRGDGVVKVLDFGLAKAADPSDSATHVTQAHTISTPAMTRAGVVLGTAAYMSPEQAVGEPADKRADIWAFGCVLYEMLCGRRAFSGDGVTEILSAVLTKHPDWEALPPQTPRPVRTLLRRCLQKDRQRRIRDIGDVRMAIEDVFDGETETTTTRVAIAQRGWRRAVPVIAAIVVTGSAAGLLGWRVWPTFVGRVSRFEFDVPIGEAFRGAGFPVFALSSDGRRLAYNLGHGLYVREMDALDAHVIPGTEAPLLDPFFSPDGREVGYWDLATSQLMRISVTGGAPVAIAHTEPPRGAAWAPDDTIFFGQANGIQRVPAAGGTPQLAIAAKDGERVYGPQVLPGGESLLFSVSRVTESWDEGAIVVQSLQSDERKVLLQPGSDARYVPPDRLVFVRGDGLFAAQFDVKRLALIPGIVSLVKGVERPAASEDTRALAQFGVSSEGTLVYLPPRSFSATLVWVDRRGGEEALNTPPRQYVMPRISPDGTEIAVTIPTEQRDIWIWSLPRQTLRQFTFEPGIDTAPLWSPDGQRIVYASQQGGGPPNLFWRAADGTGAAARLTQSANAQLPNTFSKDGSQVIFSEFSGSGADLGIVAVQGDHQVKPLLNSPATEWQAAVSPSGRWVAYESSVSGGSEIYVQAFPDLDGAKFKVSTSGGTRPVWSRDGKELFYFIPPGRVMAVPVDAGNRFSSGNPRMVVDGAYVAPEAAGAYDVSPDGQRFLMIKPVTPAASGIKLVIVQNWQEELNRLAPANPR